MSKVIGHDGVRFMVVDDSDTKKAIKRIKEKKKLRKKERRIKSSKKKQGNKRNWQSLVYGRKFNWKSMAMYFYGGKNTDKTISKSIWSIVKNTVTTRTFLMAPGDFIAPNATKSSLLQRSG